MATESKKPAPPQPSSRRVRIEEMGGDLELSFRQRAGCGIVLVLVWLTGWTAGCVLAVCAAFAQPCVQTFLMAPPFLASWVVAFVLLFWGVFGVERVRLGFDGLEYQAVALIPLWQRWIPLAELKSVRADFTSYQVNERNLPYLKFETLGQPLCFARGISEEELHGLVERLNRCLEALRPSELAKNECAIGESETGRGELLQPAASPLEPPSDSRIAIHADLETIAFVWQGNWCPNAIWATTLLHLFWNGLVGLFIYQLIQDFHWLLFFFLIPFEIIGLLFCAAWFAALTAPVWRLTWTFGEREIVRRLSVSDAEATVINLGWSKRFNVQSPVRIELRRREGQKGTASFWALLSHPDGEYNLSLLDGEDKQWLAIKDLTEGDARWFADVLLRAFPSWRNAA